MATEVDCTETELGRECADPVQNFNIEKIIHHESYNSPNPFQNDIALVRLDRDIEENGKNIDITV